MFLLQIQTEEGSEFKALSFDNEIELNLFTKGLRKTKTFSYPDYYHKQQIQGNVFAYRAFRLINKWRVRKERKDDRNSC